MKVSLTPDKSLYQFILTQKIYNSSSVLSLSPVSLLSLLSSQIDLLIEEGIRATLWVKLPPGKIWRSEIQRYYSWLGDSANIFNFYANHPISENVTSNLNSLQLETNTTSSYEDTIPFTNLELNPEYQLAREYFLIVQSPQWCSLIVSHRPQINSPQKIAFKTKINRKYFYQQLLVLAKKLFSLF